MARFGVMFSKTPCMPLNFLQESFLFNQYQLQLARIPALSFLLQFLNQPASYFPLATHHTTFEDLPLQPASSVHIPLTLSWIAPFQPTVWEAFFTLLFQLAWRDHRARYDITSSFQSRLPALISPFLPIASKILASLILEHQAKLKWKLVLHGLFEILSIVIFLISLRNRLLAQIGAFLKKSFQSLKWSYLNNFYYH